MRALRDGGGGYLLVGLESADELVLKISRGNKPGCQGAEMGVKLHS